MSSPSSAPDPSTVDHQAALTEALSEVGGLSFFGFVEPVAPTHFPDLAEAEPEWIAAAVPFKGGFAGAVHCAVPLDLARELMSNFSGDAESADADGPLHDLMGEFTNMVCGSWLSRAQSHQVFSLGRPEVTRMPGGWSPGVNEGTATVLAVLNDRPVAVWMNVTD